ncbi:hypothetical protein AAVH_34172 [Aphelenchoides avenae]|nr:hypothetical protein AAVH_34172 [Aphelenchus avenae]
MFQSSWFLRALQYKILPKSLLEFPGCGMIYTTAGGYFTYFEYLSHFAIAINRYTAIVYPEYKSKVWDGKILKVILLGMFLVPFILIAVRLADANVVVENDDGFAVKRTTPWVNAAHFVRDFRHAEPEHVAWQLSP